MKWFKLILALVLSVIAYGGLWYYFGWKLALFIFLAVWANNINSTQK